MALFGLFQSKVVSFSLFCSIKLILNISSINLQLHGKIDLTLINRGCSEQSQRYYQFFIISKILMQGQSLDQRIITDTVLMIRPFRFRSNEMTAINNFYQEHNIKDELQRIHVQSLKQFDQFQQHLSNAGVNVIAVQDNGKHDTPDSVFPNNWVSFHQSGEYNLYPMFAPNRRLQRDIDIFSPIKDNGTIPRLRFDYSQYQLQHQFLEGTGSMILDRKYRIAYAAISPRTSQTLFHLFCKDNGYKPCTFQAFQRVNGKRQLIYHTNVMIWIGQDIACICLKSIDDQQERANVLKELQASHKQIIQLTEEQISHFGGNCLMLQGKSERVIVMSKKAYQAYTPSQISKLNSYGRIVSSDIETIQKYGGGSARCMLAEIF